MIAERAEQKSEDLREEQAILRTFMKHPGWSILERHARFQQGNYQREALKPIETIDRVPAGEFKKGVAQGIEEVIALPEQLLEEIENELEARTARERMKKGSEDGEGTDDDSDDGL